MPASSGSTSTAAELMKYMVQMEKGELVDAWSSREIKKLLYLTDQRIRYAASPVLDDSAVYFKSGSLYGCKPEKGYDCGKFLGNRDQLHELHGDHRIPRPGAEIRYAVVVLSNVLRKNHPRGTRKWERRSTASSRASTRSRVRRRSTRSRRSTGLPFHQHIDRELRR